MKIKSAKSFRKHIWEKPRGGNKEKSIDYNFVGSFAEIGNETRHGFFKMYHGIKPDIAGFLPSLLKIAEDGQAIYEFLQNAVDCNSTHFYIFYNEKYFLAINNGEPFDTEGLQSVLNIAQTTKKSCDKIGRFGIGFKLVHRLVGKNEGVSELVNQYKGPILFSWSKLQDLQGLRSKETLEPIFTSDENDQAYQNAPYLLKLILTNFPAEPNETVKDLLYNDRVVFNQEELNELIDFLNYNFQQHAENISINALNQGSIFFLRLGEGKKEMLDKDYQDLKQGIQYSMNTLKKLQNVYLNDEFIQKQDLDLEEFEIPINSNEFALINPEYKECNIKVSFGYYRNYKKSTEIKSSPNFYKYFPMGDETNGFSFIIHCDSFSNEANRRKLQKDSINKNLLPIIANFVIERLNNYKTDNREQFLRLYACLILSDVPDKQNNDWLKSIFYDIFLSYLRANIPTKNNKFSDKPENVKINKLKINLDLADFGLDHIQWFEWESKNDLDLVKEARNKEKLTLETWSFSEVLEHCNIEKTNEFTLKTYNSSIDKYSEFIDLINDITELEWEKDNFKLYNKFTELSVFSYKDKDNTFLASLIYCLSKNVIILQSKHSNLKPILEKLGFLVSSQYIDKDLSPIGKLICKKVAYINEENKFYDIIATQCALQANNLNVEEKQLLFKHLQELQGIGEGTIKKLSLFSNQKNEIKLLFELVDSSISTPTWVNSLKIKAEENFAGLKKYLISEKDLYQEIILPNWNSIISEVTNVEEFYEKIKSYYDKDEKNTPLKNQAFVFINESDRFVSVNDIFYNTKFAQITNYKDFQSAVYNLTDTQTPNKSILHYLKEAPFKVENTALFDYNINNEIELSFSEIKVVLAFCKSNSEMFFENCTIESQDNDFNISEKSSNVYQIRPPKKEIRQFIEKNLDDTFKILPYEFDEYKDETGIIQGEKLYELIISNIDVDDFKEELIDILAYDEPKRKFLLQLSEIRFVSNVQYDKDSFEYKVVNLACNMLKKEEFEVFKAKIVIETEEQDLTLAEIPPFANKIKIDGCELSLAKILPNAYQNSDQLSNVINQLIGSGISKDKIHDLFGISQEPELSDIFDLFSNETTILENAEQLAFVFLYGKYEEEIDFGKFNAINISGNEVSLKYDKYINEFDFICNTEILHKRYKEVSKYLQNFPIIIEYADNLLLIKQPYFTDNEFICPYIIEDMTDEQKLSFIEFLFNQWDKKNKKTIIKNINWSKISEIETEKLLGFNPNYSIYPSEYALESEELPEYLQKWIIDDKNRISFIADLGVFTEGSTLVSLRKYFLNQSDFNKAKLAQDTRFKEEKMLFNTFEWLKSKELELNSKEEFEVFEEMVRVINSNRVKGQELIIEDEYDFELLENEAIEWNASYYYNWKEELEDKFSIYLFNEALPKNIELDEIYDCIFYRFNQDDIVIDDKNNIYVNQNIDIKNALSSLIAGKNDFSTEDLLLLYQTKETVHVENNEVADLKSEVERLRQRVAELEGVSRTVTYNATVSHDDDYHNVIKEKSEAYLFSILKKLYPSQIVKWLNYDEINNKFEESWKNHDFEILDKKGNVLHYIDCKGTPQNKKTFYLTSNEWNFFLDCVKNETSYQVYRIFNVEGNTNYVAIDNLWEWIETGKVVPYLSATETIKGGRVFLTLA